MWFYQRPLLATQSKSRSSIEPSRPPPKDKRIDELATQRQLKTFRSLDWDWACSLGLRLAVCSPRNMSASGVVPPLITDGAGARSFGIHFAGAWRYGKLAADASNFVSISVRSEPSNTARGCSTDLSGVVASVANSVILVSGKRAVG